MTIEWNDEKMATGFPEIDAQHKEWIRRINEFDDAVTNRKGQEAIQNTLDFLAQYSETHFIGEEAIMAKHNSPALGLNRAEHEEFRGKLAEIRTWVKNAGATSVEVVALKSALEDWLVNHISTVDVQLRKIDPDV
ncbi:MAG TPA: bacteriohemerythrin [Anaerolineales bacterium]